MKPGEKVEIPTPTPDEIQENTRADAEADDLERPLHNQRLRFNLWIGWIALVIVGVATITFVAILVIVVWHMLAPMSKRWLEVSNIQTLTLVLATGSFVTNLVSPALKYIRGEQL